MTISTDLVSAEALIEKATHKELDKIKKEHSLYEPCTGRGALLFPQIKYRRVNLKKSLQKKLKRLGGN